MSSTRLLTFDDPYAFMSSVRATNVRLIPTARGQFRADLRQVAFQRLWMQRARESLPRIAHSVVTSARVGIDFPTRWDQPSMWHDGLEVPPGRLVLNDSNPAQKRTVAASEYATMSLALADFVAAGRIYLGRDLAPPTSSRVFRPVPNAMARLVRLHAIGSRLASRVPDRLAHPQIALSLEHALVRALVRCLMESTTIEPTTGQRNHTAIMRKVEDLLASRGNQPLHLATLCTATDVSERTLRNCFQERFGMGPIRYLWLRRMHQARRALLLADPAETTVTRIATAFGFWELGRFAVAYRGLFGEHPSTTLSLPAGRQPRSQSETFDGDPAKAA